MAELSGHVSCVRPQPAGGGGAGGCAPAPQRPHRHQLVHALHAAAHCGHELPGHHLCAVAPARHSRVPVESVRWSTIAVSLGSVAPQEPVLHVGGDDVSNAHKAVLAERLILALQVLMHAAVRSATVCIAHHNPGRRLSAEVHARSLLLSYVIPAACLKMAA